MSNRKISILRTISMSLGVVAVVLIVISFYYNYVLLNDEVGMFFLTLSMAPLIFSLGMITVLLNAKEKEKMAKKERTKKMRLTEEGTVNKELEALEDTRLLLLSYGIDSDEKLEKTLKALKIIKEHFVDIAGTRGNFENKKPANEIVIVLKDLTKEEYDLLKEVLF